MSASWHALRSSLLLLAASLLLTTFLPANAIAEPLGDPKSAGDSSARAPRAPYPPGEWVQDSTPTAFQLWRFGGVYFDDSSGQPYARKIYFLGGRTSSNTTDGSIWWFDPFTETYGQPAGNPSLPTPLSNHRPVILNDGSPNGLAIYMFGGRIEGGAYTTAVQAYYPKANTSATIATDPWPGMVAGNVTQPGDVVVYNNKAYAIGGSAVSGGAMTDVSAETWIYNPAAAPGSRWTQAQSMYRPRAYLSAAVVDGKIYAMGGDSWDGALLNVLPDVERFDPADPGHAWVVRTAMPLADSGIAGCDESQAFGFDSTSATTFPGKILISGCGQWAGEYLYGFVYNTASDSWASGPKLNQARRNFASALVPITAVGWQAWVFGGRQQYDTTVLTTAEHIDLQSSLFIPLVNR